MPDAKVEREIPSNLPRVLRIPLVGAEAFVHGYVGLIFAVSLCAAEKEVSKRISGKGAVKRKSPRRVTALRVFVLGFERDQDAGLEGVCSASHREVIGKCMARIIVGEWSKDARRVAEAANRNAWQSPARAAGKHLRYVDVGEVLAQRVPNQGAPDRVSG